MSFLTAIEPLLDCMCSALAVVGWSGECCVIPGRMGLENGCCDQGVSQKAYARLVSAYPSSNFPNEDRGTASECEQIMQWALVVELGATRCVCQDGCGCEQRAENASLVLGDMEAALAGLLCCFSSGSCRDSEFRINSATTVGPDDGCGGFKIELVRQYVLSCCPPQEES